MSFTTKKYNVFKDSIQVMEVEYPASVNNSKWYGLTMWNETTGFVKTAELVTGDNIRWSIEEVWFFGIKIKISLDIYKNSATLS